MVLYVCVCGLPSGTSTQCPLKESCLKFINASDVAIRGISFAAKRLAHTQKIYTIYMPRYAI